MKSLSIPAIAVLILTSPSLAYGQAGVTSKPDPCGFQKMKDEIKSAPLCPDNPACYPRWLALDQRLQATIDCQMKFLEPKNLAPGGTIPIASPK